MLCMLCYIDVLSNCKGYTFLPNLQSLPFLNLESENIFLKCSLSESWQNLWHLASGRRRFSKDCCCFGFIILCPFSSTQLYWSLRYLLKPILIVWEWESFLPLPLSKGNFQSFFYTSNYLEPSHWVPPTHKGSVTDSMITLGKKKALVLWENYRVLSYMHNTLNNNNKSRSSWLQDFPRNTVTHILRRRT